eukprot:COSAG03_NODE_28648_length_195_cov_85.083333_1_plen_65_part_11
MHCEAEGARVRLAFNCDIQIELWKSTHAHTHTRAQAVSDAAAANQARLTAQDEANVAANADTAAA